MIASVRNSVDIDVLKSRGLLNVIQLDLRSTTSIKSAVEQTLEISGGQLFALFNNGAYAVPGAVEDLTRDAVRRQFETNFFGTLELTNLLLPTMLRQSDARIVQCSSVLGLVALPYRGAYNASKFALEGLTDTLRQELDNTPVKVSLIEPGPILTHFRKNALVAFKEEIDRAGSRHRDVYEAIAAKLDKEGAAVPFTLGPEAVTKKLIHALESDRPRPRYHVTFPTCLMGFLRRTLSTRLLDKFSIKVG